MIIYTGTAAGNPVIECCFQQRVQEKQNLFLQWSICFCRKSRICFRSGSPIWMIMNKFPGVSVRSTGTFWPRQSFLSPHSRCVRSTCSGRFRESRGWSRPSTGQTAVRWRVPDRRPSRRTWVSSRRCCAGCSPRTPGPENRGCNCNFIFRINNKLIERLLQNFEYIHNLLFHSKRQNK